MALAGTVKAVRRKVMKRKYYIISIFLLITGLLLMLYLHRILITKTESILVDSAETVTIEKMMPQSKDTEKENSKSEPIVCISENSTCNEDMNDEQASRLLRSIEVFTEIENELGRMRRMGTVYQTNDPELVSRRCLATRSSS